MPGVTGSLLTILGPRFLPARAELVPPECACPTSSQAFVRAFGDCPPAQLQPTSASPAVALARWATSSGGALGRVLFLDEGLL
eukprot:362306-Chlamydomonas_euryale.AAC.10